MSKILSCLKNAPKCLFMAAEKAEKKAYKRFYSVRHETHQIVDVRSMDFAMLLAALLFLIPAFPNISAG